MKEYIVKWTEEKVAVVYGEDIEECLRHIRDGFVLGVVEQKEIKSVEIVRSES